MLGGGALFYWVNPFPLNLPFIGHWFLLDLMRPPQASLYPEEFLFQLIAGCTLLSALAGWTIFRTKSPSPLKDRVASTFSRTCGPQIP